MNFIRIKMIPVSMLIADDKFIAMQERDRFNLLLIWAKTFNSFLPADPEVIASELHTKNVNLEAMEEYLDTFSEECMRAKMDERRRATRNVGQIDDSDSCYPFESFWHDYDKSAEKFKARAKWAALGEETKGLIREHVKLYVRSTPERKFRKSAFRYLTHRLWEDGDPKDAGYAAAIIEDVVIPELK